MDEMLKQKVAIITKDLDSGYLVFNRFAANLMTMRGWSLPLVLAYMALLINNNATNLWALAPLGVVLLLFIYLEAGDRRDMDAIRTDICKVQKIFMESDEKKFTEQIAQYQFRESRRLDGASRLRFLALRVFGWYGLLFLLSSISYLGSIKIRGHWPPRFW